WERRDYLGVGCAAHSLLRGERFANSRALDTWLSDIEAGHMAEASREILSLQAQRFEAMMLGLRLTRGVDLEEFTQRYQATPFTCYGSALEILRAQGLAQWDEKRLWLTPRGLDLQNTVLVSLMD
ncbi:MAG: coproporphyrinogen III oxidase, partial [Clostridia bacterium]